MKLGLAKQIVLQDSVDNESAGNDAGEHPDNDSEREEDQVDVVDEDGAQCGDEYFDNYARDYDVDKEDGSRKKSPIKNSHAADIEEEVDGSSPQRTPSDHRPGSRGHASSENVGSPYEERYLSDVITLVVFRNHAFSLLFHLSSWLFLLQ